MDNNQTKCNNKTPTHHLAAIRTKSQTMASRSSAQKGLNSVQDCQRPFLSPLLPTQGQAGKAIM